MALTIHEYSTLALAGASGTTLTSGQMPKQPPLVVQTAVTIGATSLQSTAFGAGTSYIEISADVNCRVLVGANPTATANNTLLPAGAILYYGVNAGDKIAVIAA